MPPSKIRPQMAYTFCIILILSFDSPRPPLLHLTNKKMTTYGTIPTLIPPPSNLHVNISRAKDKIKNGFGTRRPWNEMIQLHSLKLPTSVGQTNQRIKTNITFFRVNYAMMVLFILFLSLLWHPISLIVFIVMIVAWLFLYFLRDEPLMVFGRLIDDRVMLMALSSVTIIALYITDVRYNLIVALSISLVAVIVHGAFRETEDLFILNIEEGTGSSGGNAKVPLKTAASSSYSLS